MDRFLAKRLSVHRVAVINSGISGNRLLTDGMGDRVLKRLNSEIFQYSGVKTLIVLVGINDISWPVQLLLLNSKYPLLKP